MIPYNFLVACGATLFAIGGVGLLLRRNLLVMFLCLEIMLNAVTLTFVGLSRLHLQMDGQVFVFFILLIAAVEAAVGLAVFLYFYRGRDSIQVDDANWLKW